MQRETHQVGVVARGASRKMPLFSGGIVTGPSSTGIDISDILLII